MQTKHGLGDVLILYCAFINLVIFQTAFAKNDLSTLEGFAAAFRQANTGKDTAQLEQLVFWNEAKQSWKTALQQRLKEGLGHKIDKIQILPFSGESRAFGSFLAHPTPSANTCVRSVVCSTARQCWSANRKQVVSDWKEQW